MSGITAVVGGEAVLLYVCTFACHVTVYIRPPLISSFVFGWESLPAVDEYTTWNIPYSEYLYSSTLHVYVRLYYPQSKFQV